MDKTKEDPFGFESLLNTWVTSVQGMVESMPEMWAAFQPADPDKDRDNSKQLFESMAAAVKSWQTFATAMATPESLGAFLKGAETLPGMAAQFSQAVIESLSEIQKRMGRSATSFGESVEAYRFEKLDENLLHAWSDIYEKEFQKFFHIPQLGLTREYQERFNDMQDKFHQFQANQAEFLRLMSLPFQRSNSVMHEKIAELAESGELPEDINEYYQMWVKILEGHFMTLFQTPEYVEALSKTVTTFSRFSKAKDLVIEDMIKGLPITPRSEADELAKEIYELKKRVRALEKKGSK
ncbi:MAG: hypothetical protein MI862_27600 [Desulfobacterales bacterium]|nr:hypothetical protein [Desulfobacterales bacterium]